MYVNMDSNLEIIRNQVVAFCNEKGYSLAPDAEKILRDIVGMKETVGDFYYRIFTRAKKLVSYYESIKVYNNL